MWHLPRFASIDAVEIYKNCVLSYDPADQRRIALTAAEGEVAQADMDYEAAFGAGRGHTLTSSQFESSAAHTDLFVELYDKRFAARASIGRPIYDAIKSLAEHERCPLCGHRSADTLDHFLPKRKFPTLSVNPRNLIPACGKCNQVKSSRVASRSDEALLHPYYDDINADTWLLAQVIEAHPVGVRFRVEAPANWTNDLARRVNGHFHVLGLGSLYAAQAGQELSNIAWQVAEAYKRGGERELTRHLRECADSRANYLRNSWQTAFYEALVASDRFCEGGFLGKG